MSAKKKVTPGLLSGLLGSGADALSDKAKPWALGLLVLALISCLTAWGMREVSSSRALSKATERLSTVQAESLSKTASLSLLEQSLRETKAQLEQTKQTASIHRKTKVTHGADGSSSEETEEALEFAQEVLSQTIEERAEALSRAESAETALTQTRSQVDSLKSSLALAEASKVTHKGVGALAGISYDLAGLGDPAGTDEKQRLRFEGGAYWTVYELGLSLQPFGPTSDAAPTDEDWRDKLKRMAPALRLGMRF